MLLEDQRSDLCRFKNEMANPALEVLLNSISVKFLQL